MYCWPAAARAQATPAATTGDCSCSQVYSQLLQKLETNYVGFHLQKASLGSQYAAHKQQYAQLAAKGFR